MDYQTFRTREEAQAEEAKMMGWRTATVKMAMPYDDNADEYGNAWIIQCLDLHTSMYKFLRRDGYVR